MLLGRAGELGEVAKEQHVDGGGGTVAMLGHDQVCVFPTGSVSSSCPRCRAGAVKQYDDVCVLFEASRFPQITHMRLLVSA